MILEQILILVFLQNKVLKIRPLLLHVTLVAILSLCVERHIASQPGRMQEDKMILYGTELFKVLGQDVDYHLIGRGEVTIVEAL